MVKALNDIHVADGDKVAAGQIATAVTAGPFRYADGATQTFEHDGTTEYIEHGRTTSGQWYVEDSGRFGSFWPPSYRATYDLHWMVDHGRIVGLRFTDVAGSSAFEGRYTER